MVLERLLASEGEPPSVEDVVHLHYVRVHAVLDGQGRPVGIGGLREELLEERGLEHPPVLVLVPLVHIVLIIAAHLLAVDAVVHGGQLLVVAHQDHRLAVQYRTEEVEEGHLADLVEDDDVDVHVVEVQRAVFVDDPRVRCACHADDVHRPQQDAVVVLAVVGPHVLRPEVLDDLPVGAHLLHRPGLVPAELAACTADLAFEVLEDVVRGIRRRGGLELHEHVPGHPVEPVADVLQVPVRRVVLQATDLVLEIEYLATQA